ncbi:hypothetical protein BGX28_004146 [Mortierella sp. GBA30]|nr:hypothetical protein BGX28_004146 [Mortierella sp. GBA30]
MLPSTPLPASCCSCARLFTKIGCRSILTQVTGNKLLPSPPTTLFRCQANLQRRHGHSWISGHPHSLLFKPATAGNKVSGNKTSSTNGTMTGFNGATGSSTNSANTSANTATSFLEFAGNGRYQAYHLARFSTLSALSSSSSSMFPTGSKTMSTITPSPGSGSPEKKTPSSSSHADRAYSNPADAEVDAQSPLSQSSGASASSGAPSSSSSSSSTAAASLRPSSSSKEQDDKDDDWAVNESYSGHGDQTFTATSPIPSSSSSSSSSSSPSTNASMSSASSEDDNDNDNNSDDDDTSRPKLQPSLSSFKSPADIEKSWRRTSETLPSASSSGPPVLTPSPPSKAGGLDLSSSTLVQQMLFKERVPHTDSSSEAEDNRRHSKEGNHKASGTHMSNDDDEDWHHDWHRNEKHLAERKV